MGDKVVEINELMEENYCKMKKNGKFWILIILSLFPDLYYSTQSLHVIKLKSKEFIRCEIPVLENTSWTSKEIQKISQPVDGIHKECFINDYNYYTIRSMSLDKAEKFLEENYPKNKVKLCTKFVAHRKSLSEDIFNKYPQEFLYYCRSVPYDIYYDILALISNILSCLFFVPFADILGRKRILSIGCYLAFLSVFVRVCFLDFTRNAAGDMIQNVVYPAIKFSTQTIIFEISGNVIRPLAFVLGFAGLYIPFIVVAAFPPMYWKYLELLKLLPVVFLPLVTWYFFDPPLWFISTKEFKVAHFVAENLNNFTLQNEISSELCNRKVTVEHIKNHLRQLKKFTNDLKFIILALISIGVGFLSFYPYSKHKFLYHYFEDSGLRYLNYCGGLFTIILCVFCLYLCEVKYSLMIFLCANGVLFIILGYFNSEFPYRISNVVMISLIEVTASALNILYQFYLQKITPTSHKCTCLGISIAIANFGLLTISGIRLLKISSSDFFTAVVSLFGVIFGLKFMKIVRPTSLQILINFSDTEEESNCPDCCRWFKK